MTIKINSIQNSDNIKTPAGINFTSNEIKTKPYSADTVELSSQKESKNKNSVLKKVALGSLAFAGTLVAVILAFAKHQNNKFSKLYKEKLVLANLPEKINFKEAKTLEEAMKFSKETLGIKDVSQDFTLDALNIANRGLVDVSNANKGKLFMPPVLRFEECKDDSWLAFVVQNVDSKYFGNLVINKKYFNHDFLNNQIYSYLRTKDGQPTFVYDNVSKQFKRVPYMGHSVVDTSKELQNMVLRFYNNASGMSIKDKQTLYYSLMEGADNALKRDRNPIGTLKEIQSKFGSVLKSSNTEINFEEVEKLSPDKQVAYMEKIIKKLEAEKKYLRTYYRVVSPSEVIHHEMGHLQDYAKNLRELDLKHWKLDLAQIWRDSWHKARTGEDVSRIGIDEVTNRWGSLENDYINNMLKENPEKFKKLWPDLYKFATDKDIQCTAGKVSGYAQAGIGEFVAECYMKMLAGEKLPEDVMALYRQYKGPAL